MTRRTPRSTRFGWAAIAALALSLAAMAAISAAKDRNGDGLPDRWERSNDLSLQVNQAHRDQDGDQLRNRGEYKAGTDPRDEDTDGDGIADGDEGAGTITEWDPDTGELTVGLFGGKSVTGTVTDETQIECRNDDATEPDDPATEAGRFASGDGQAGGGPPPHGGPDQAGEHDCDGSNCSVDDLAVDGVVSEASLRLTSDGLVFVEIELG